MAIEPAELKRMGSCAMSAWQHGVAAYEKPVTPRPGVTTAHILLGVLKEETCAGGLILGKLGLNLRLAYITTEFVLHYGRRREGNGDETVDWGGVPHTQPAWAVMDIAFEEANLFSPTYPIGTEHLVLGLLRVPEGTGYRLLQHFGLEVHHARAARDELWDLLRTFE